MINAVVSYDVNVEFTVLCIIAVLDACVALKLGYSLKQVMQTFSFVREDFNFLISDLLDGIVEPSVFLTHLSNAVLFLKVLVEVFLIMLRILSY